eukprot:5398610-Pyramimonas_sp.AAC.1
MSYVLLPSNTVALGASGAVFGAPPGVHSLHRTVSLHHSITASLHHCPKQHCRPRSLRSTLRCAPRCTLAAPH